MLRPNISVTTKIVSNSRVMVTIHNHVTHTSYQVILSDTELEEIIQLKNGAEPFDPKGLPSTHIDAKFDEIGRPLGIEASIKDDSLTEEEDKEESADDGDSIKE